MDKKNDNITKILKSIKPIKNQFSKISKGLNQLFKYKSIENLKKIMDKKQVYKDLYIPNLDKDVHKNDYNINFHNSIEYLNELSDINNLPLVSKNKSYLINGEFNPDYEIENLKKESNKNYLIKQKKERKKEQIKKRIKLLKNYKERDSNPIIGMYDPNYEAIQRRSPCAIICDPGVHLKNSWMINNPFRNTFEEFKKKQNKLKEKLHNENSQTLTENNDNKTTSSNINTSTKEFPKYNRNIKRIQKIHENSSKNNSQSIYSYTHEILQEKNNESINLDLLFQNNKKTKLKIRKIRGLNLPQIKYERKNNSTLKNNSNSIKGYIVFDKMEKRKSLFHNKASSISYSPDYNFILPHTPSYLFKYTKDKQNYKKYINGKIIRGYNPNSNSYYVMQLKNKNIYNMKY